MKFEVDFFPTEDKEKLKELTKNLFPDAELEFTGDKITGSTDSRRFWDLVDEQEIKPTILERLDKGYIDLSKTAALKLKVSVSLGSEVGKIRLYK